MRRTPTLMLALAAVAAITLAVPTVGGQESGWLSGDAWRQDLEALDLQVRSTHPDPFSRTPEDVWQARLTTLARTLPALDEVAAKAEVMRLVGLLDSHSSADPGRNGFHMYPMYAWQILDDGVYLLAAPDEADAGARVLAIGSMPMDLVLAAIRPWVNADNESGFRSLAPWIMSSAELLRAAGVIDDIEHPAIHLRRRDGTIVVQDPPAYTLEEVDSGAVPLVDGFIPTEAVGRSNEPVWWRMDEPSRTFILAYNSPGADVSEAVAAMTEALDTGAVDRVVLDLRMAPGGAYHASLALVDALAADDRIDRPDRLAVIVGRNSASATTALVSSLEQGTMATFIGEPTPARPNTFLDPVELDLPSSGITYYIPSTVMLIAGPDDQRDAVYPDIPVAVLSKDVLIGRDRALEVALAPR